MAKGENTLGSKSESEVIDSVRLRIKRTDVLSVNIVDTDLVIVTKTGSKLVIRDGAIRSMVDKGFVVSFMDTDVTGADLFRSAGDAPPRPLTTYSVGTNPEVAAMPSRARSVDSNDSDGASNANSSSATGVDSGGLSAGIDDSRGASLSGQGSQAAFDDAMAPRFDGFSPETDAFASQALPVAASAASKGITSSTMTWALGALAVAGVAGGGSKAAAGAAGGSGNSTSSLALDITGYAGSFIAQEKIAVYDAKGNRVGGGLTDSSGHATVTVTVTSGYVGPLLIQLSNNGANVDYNSEGTGTATKLVNPLRSIINYTGQTAMTVVVTPLTELAATTITGSNNSTVSLTPPAQATDVIKQNQAVANLFGLTDVTTDKVAVIGLDGKFATGTTPQAQIYGAVLAALAGYDVFSGSTQSTLGAIDVTSSASAQGVVAGGVNSIQVTAIQNTAQSVFAGVNAFTANAADVANALNKAGTGGLSSLTPAEIKGLNSSQLGSLTSDQLASLLSAQLLSLTSTQISQLTSAQINALGSGSMFVLTPYQLAGLGTNAAGLTGAEVQSLHLAKGTLSSIALAAIPLSSVPSLSSDQLATIGVQAAGLSSAQVQLLTANAVPGLQSSALTALGTNFLSMSGTAISQLNPSSLMGLNYAQINGLTLKSRYLTTAQIVALGASVNELSSAGLFNLPTEDVAALQPSQVATLGAAVGGFTLSQIAALGGNIAYLGSAALGALNSAAFAQLGTEVLKTIPAQSLAGMSSAQLAALGGAIGSLSPDQLLALGSATQGLTQTQINALGTQIS